MNFVIAGNKSGVTIVLSTSSEASITKCEPQAKAKSLPSKNSGSDLAFHC